MSTTTANIIALVLAYALISSALIYLIGGDRGHKYVVLGKTNIMLVLWGSLLLVLFDRQVALFLTVYLFAVTVLVGTCTMVLTHLLETKDTQIFNKIPRLVFTMAIIHFKMFFAKFPTFEEVEEVIN